MTTPSAATDTDRTTINGANRRTLDQVFHYPISHNLAWEDVVTLARHIGHVEERSNDHFVFKVGREAVEMHKPHTHHLTAPEVMDVRHFLSACGWAPETHADKSESDKS